jgi:hypothetical protein
MAPADVHPNNMSNDPFAAFGAAPAEQPVPSAQQPQNGNEDPWAAMNSASQTMAPPPQQPVINECADPWASMNGQVVPNGMPPAMPSQPPVEQMQNNGITDPWAGMNGQQQAAMPPQPPAMAPPASVLNTDPFASMNGSAQPQAAPVVQQPPAMMYQQAPASAWNQQPVVPNTMAPVQQPMMSPPQMMQPQESVPSTVVCNGEGASPPSPIGDQSVVGNQARNAPEVPVFDQQPMMPIQEQPQQHVMSEPSVNPFEMQPSGQEQQFNAQMPLQEQPQVNAPANPFGEVGLTGQMNNLSMQNGVAYGMPPAENPTDQVVVNGMNNGVPLMPPNCMPPPPPSVQPPIPPAEPPMPPQQPYGMEQAPLSPVDPFAVTSPVVSPGVALSPQFNDPFGYAFSPMTSPTEGQRANLAMPAALPEMPYMNGSLNSSTGGADPFGCQAVVPSNAANDDPFGVFGSAPAVTGSDPFGASMANDNAAVVQSNQVVDDPFGIFGSPTPVQQQPPAQPSDVPSAAAQDPWAAAGFNELPQTSLLSVTSDDEGSEAPVELDTNGLPKQGDYYEARINARSLGAMFYTARDLENTLLYHMPTNVIDSMKSRPIVAYVAENSAAHNSGVHLGHCILSVNGTEVSNPDECADVIRNASRPMNIRGYVMPELEVTLAEGKHMVKYDKKDLGAPPTKMEWKEKYVVVGGIVAKPWVMNMYRSKVRVFEILC